MATGFTGLASLSVFTNKRNIFFQIFKNICLNSRRKYDGHKKMNIYFIRNYFKFTLRFCFKQNQNHVYGKHLKIVLLNEQPSYVGVWHTQENIHTYVQMKYTRCSILLNKCWSQGKCRLLKLFLRIDSLNWRPSHRYTNIQTHTHAYTYLGDM